MASTAVTPIPSASYSLGTCGYCFIIVPLISAAVTHVFTFSFLWPGNMWILFLYLTQLQPCTHPSSASYSLVIPWTWLFLSHCFNDLNHSHTYIPLASYGLGTNKWIQLLNYCSNCMQSHLHPSSASYGLGTCWYCLTQFQWSQLQSHLRLLNYCSNCSHTYAYPSSASYG